jgi:hypothetical protein
VEAGLFEQVRSIRGELVDHEDLLPGLVAVMSKPERPDLLFIYVNEPPPLAALRHTTVSIANLRDVDLTDYTGPTVGLAAIDLIRTDVPTKGYPFVRLDRILRRRGRVDLVRRTWAQLADYVAGVVEDRDATDVPVERARAEVAAIASPLKIAQLELAERRGMVAFLPGRGQAICLSSPDLHALASVSLPPGETVVALEEVRRLLEPNRDWSHESYPVELRTVLRRSRLERPTVDGEVVDLLGETLSWLGQGLYRRWQETGDIADCEAAYGVALERRLAHRDVHDLVAVLPSQDFEEFLNDGAGIYVYRSSVEEVHNNPEPQIRNVALKQALELLRSPGVPFVFSLLPLRPTCSVGAVWFDLGPGLRKVGRAEVLGRNAWLLVQDLLDRHDDREALGVELTDLYGTMAHCCAILSMSDPWRTRQGRRKEWLHECYRTLQKVIGRLADDDDPNLAGYYSALRRWFGLSLPADDGLDEDSEVERDIRADLDEILRELGSAAELARMPGSAQLDEDAVALTNIVQALRDLLGWGGRATAYKALRTPPAESMPNVIRRVTDMTAPMLLLSAPFGVSFREYASIDDEVWRCQSVQMTVRQRITRLADCVARLERQKRLIFAPHNEERVLRALYDSAIERTTELLRELRGGAALDVRLQTRSVLRSEGNNPSELILSVRNLGNVAAERIEVDLFANDSFALHDQTYKKSFVSLPPEDRIPVAYTIEPTTHASLFPVRCMVSWSHGSPSSDGDTVQTTDGDPRPAADDGARQSRTYEFMVRIRRLNEQPFQKMTNPYAFGIHVTDHRRFFGRRSELDELLSHLAGGGQQNVVLRAPRRAGKTSVLHMLQAVLRDIDRRAGVRDWFDVSPAWDEDLNAVIPVMLNLQGVEALLTKATPSEFYRAVLMAFAAEGLRSEWSDRLQGEPFIAYTQLESGLRDLLNGIGSRRVVLLLDEFDVMATMEDRLSFYQPLRTTIANFTRLTWIVVSASGLYEDLKDYASPLFNIFEIKEMGRLDSDAARALVTSPWESARGGASLGIADDAVETILEETGNHPFMLQMLCSEIVHYANDIQSNVVRSTTVNEVIDRRMVGAGASDDYFRFMWDRASATGKLLLLSLLNSLTVMRRDELVAGAVGILHSYSRPDLIPRLHEEVDHSLQQLVGMEAMRLGPSGYAFGVPLFRRVLVYWDSLNDLERAAIEHLSDGRAGGVGHG